MASGTRFKKSIPSSQYKYYPFNVPRKNQTSADTYEENDKDDDHVEDKREVKKSNLGNVVGHIIAIVGLILTVGLFMLGYVITTYNTPISDIKSYFQSINTKLNFLEQDSKDFKVDIKELRDKYDKVINNLGNFKK